MSDDPFWIRGSEWLGYFFNVWHRTKYDISKQEEEQRYSREPFFFRNKNKESN